MKEINVLLVDDHDLIRTALKSLLERALETLHVDDVASGQEAILACKQSRPHIILMDIFMPLMDGVSTLKYIKKRWPDIYILALTSNGNEWCAADAIKAGADGYILKKSSAHSLVNAIIQVQKGETPLDNNLNIDQVNSIIHLNKMGKSSLTARERQILKLVSEGLLNREISQLLCISLKTVESHRMNLMKKLDAHNAASLTQWAYRLGLSGDHGDNRLVPSSLGGLEESNGAETYVIGNPVNTTTTTR